MAGSLDSDLSPALLRLANDPNVEAVVVLTDGLSAYPRQRLPYKVLWVLPEQDEQEFKPEYGCVITL